MNTIILEPRDFLWPEKHLNVRARVAVFRVNSAVTLMALALPVFFVLLAGCGQKNAEIPPRPTKELLVSLISSIEPWRQSTNYSRKAWNHTIQVAQVFQDSDPQLVSQALDEFIQSNQIPVHSDSEEDTKPLILLRVMFELPLTHGVSGAGRFRSHYGNSPPLTWPVGWTNGEPYLMDPCYGSSGNLYWASGDYNSFRKNFPFRKLPH